MLRFDFLLILFFSIFLYKKTLIKKHLKFYLKNILISIKNNILGLDGSDQKHSQKFRVSFTSLQFYEKRLFKTIESRSIKDEFSSKTFNPTKCFFSGTLIFFNINIQSLNFSTPLETSFSK